MEIAPKSSANTTGEPIEGGAATSSKEQILTILLQENRLSGKEIDYATRIQSKLENKKPMLEVLKGLKYISDADIEEVIRKHHVSIKLGGLLVELGYIDEENLNVALRIQSDSKNGKKLGEILVDKNFIGENVLAEMLAIQLSIDKIIPRASEIDERLFCRVPEKWYDSHSFIPIREDTTGVVVAFADPLDNKEVNAAQEIFGRNIVKAVAAKGDIQSAARKILSNRNAVRNSSVDENAVVKFVNDIILSAVDRNASDVHIEPLKDRLQIRFRQDGVLVLYNNFSSELVLPVTNRLKVLCKLDITERRRHQGGRILFEYPHGELDLRVSFYITVYGEKIVLRILNRQGQLIDLDEIGILPPTLNRFKEDALYLPSGVILITGPTGSGKTTTVYSCINKINSPDISIVTAEDPVEYVIDGISQCSINPKINLTFEETLRHIVRQDPDIIVIGEIRDKFSAEIAVQAALTGHKVLTTFHTEDSIGGLIRLLNMNIEAFMISSTVVSVMAQRLLRKICPVCAEDYRPNLTELRRIGYQHSGFSGANFRRGRGCPQCQYTGYSGRVGAYELLILDEAVREAILGQKTSQEIRKISTESTGLITLLEDGIYKAAAGLTTLEEVLRCLPRLQKPRSVEELRRLLGGL